LNSLKANFFDTQVEAEWACGAYSGRELVQIARMLELGGIGQGLKVLEPGCGTGRLTRVLADRVGPRGKVVAMDISRRMVEACRVTAGSKGNVELYCVGVEDYPLPQQAFDAVVCHQVFPHFDDKPGVLTIFARTLAPRGVLILCHFINSSEINDVHRKASEAVAHDLMPPAETLGRMFRSAGFKIECFHDDEDGYLLTARVPATQ